MLKYVFGAVPNADDVPRILGIDADAIPLTVGPVATAVELSAINTNQYNVPLLNVVEIVCVLVPTVVESISPASNKRVWVKIA